MGNKVPSLIVSDMDLALTSAIKTKFPNTNHRLCAWHLSRNLRRNFGYINQDREDIKIKILALPYYYSKTSFQTAVTEIENFLKAEKLEKSQRYLTNLLEKKAQWARAHYPSAFDADISTTSRVESWNFCIKRYLHSKSELSDLIQFISDTEKCYFYKELKVNKGVSSLLEYDSLLRNLKEILPSKIYNKILIQYALGRRDYVKTSLEGGDIPQFQVQFKNNQSPEDIFINEIDIGSDNPIYKVSCGDKIECNCGYFELTGMLCRHIFFICVTENIKDLSKLRISDRWALSLEGSSDKHFCTLPEPIVNQIEESKIEDQVQILEISTQKHDIDNVHQGIQSQAGPQTQTIIQPCVENFEKVSTNKGAPKGIRRKRDENDISKLERLEEELKRLKKTLNIDQEAEDKSPEKKNTLVRINLKKKVSQKEKEEQTESEEDEEEPSSSRRGRKVKVQMPQKQAGKKRSKDFEKGAKEETENEEDEEEPSPSRKGRKVKVQTSKKQTGKK